MFRIGIGYDIHQLVENRPLIIGGIRIPSERGAKGHSDADALSHAIIDALLGALALGDLGSHFPDTDGAYKNANSLELLHTTMGLLQNAGFAVDHVDSNVILEQPKLRPHIENIRYKLAENMEIPVKNVSVKARTNEGCGAVGRGEAIVAQAVVVLQGT